MRSLIGALVGCFNFLLILALRIPPIIATLSSSFLVQSTAIAFGRGLRIKPPPVLADFTTAQIEGVPVLAACTILFTVVMGVVLHRTVYGRWVTAIGQSIRAAHLAGVDVDRTRFFTYVLSAASWPACAATCSRASRAAPSLSMGEEYLLTSIAVVVIGGTSVAGGYANVTGLWGAALFLFLTRHHAQHLSASAPASATSPPA